MKFFVDLSTFYHSYIDGISMHISIRADRWYHSSKTDPSSHNRQLKHRKIIKYDGKISKIDRRRK